MKTFDIQYWVKKENGEEVLKSIYEEGVSFKQMEDLHPNAYSITEVVKTIPTTILGDGYNLN